MSRRKEKTHNEFRRRHSSLTSASDSEEDKKRRRRQDYSGKQESTRNHEDQKSRSSRRAAVTESLKKSGHRKSLSSSRSPRPKKDAKKSTRVTDREEKLAESSSTGERKEDLEEEKRLNRDFDPEQFVLWRYPGEGSHPLSFREEFKQNEDVGAAEAWRLSSTEKGQTLYEAVPDVSGSRGKEKYSRGTRESRSDRKQREDRRDQKHEKQAESEKDRHGRKIRGSEKDLREEFMSKPKQRRENFVVERDRSKSGRSDVGSTGRLLSDRWDAREMIRSSSSKEFSRREPGTLYSDSGSRQSESVWKDKSSSSKGPVLEKSYGSFPKKNLQKSGLSRSSRDDQDRRIAEENRQRGGREISSLKVSAEVSQRDREYRSSLQYPTPLQRYYSDNGAYAGQYGGFRRGDPAWRRRGFSRGNNRRFRGRGGGVTVVYRPGEEEKPLLNLFDPQKVPKGRGYFDHDDRELGGARWSRGGRRNWGNRPNYPERRNEGDTPWRHDMFQGDEQWTDDAPEKQWRKTEQ